MVVPKHLATTCRVTMEMARFPVSISDMWPRSRLVCACMSAWVQFRCFRNLRILSPNARVSGVGALLLDIHSSSAYYSWFVWEISHIIQEGNGRQQMS